MTPRIDLKIQNSKGKPLILNMSPLFDLMYVLNLLRVMATTCLRIELNYLYSDKTCVFVYVQITDIYSG